MVKKNAMAGSIQDTSGRPNLTGMSAALSAALKPSRQQCLHPPDYSAYLVSRVSGKASSARRLSCSPLAYEHLSMGMGAVNAFGISSSEGTFI